ncbi:MAG: hypothetical protein ACR652_18425 [Methylocystis sp.]|uniref:hypothetical protein n=1 Tax=Methylocystis sp. TaxID=1911079 RepID=UPI003DA358B4
MKSVYVYSTLSADQLYTTYVKGGNDIPRPERTVLIKGGANVATKHLLTPRGVVTQVTAEELALLRDNKLFQLHEKNGYVKVDTSKQEVEKAVTDMEPRDESSPLVPGDFQVDNKPEPVLNLPDAPQANETPAAPAKPAAGGRPKGARSRNRK